MVIRGTVISHQFDDRDERTLNSTLRGFLKRSKSDWPQAELKGYENTIRFVTDRGADVNATTENSGHPLRIAVMYTNEHTIRYLLEAGADLNVSVERFETALEAACARRTVSVPIAKLLLRHEAILGNALEEACAREQEGYQS